MVSAGWDVAPGGGRARSARPHRIVRRLGFTGTLLMAIGALGAGALPVPNPLNGLRLLGLPGRNATLAIAITYTGLITWCWPGCGSARCCGPTARSPPPPPGSQLARTAVLWAVPLAIAPPMFSRDVYSYLAQSAILARGLDPYTLGPAEALGIDDPLTRSIPTIWRDTPAPYGPLFLLMGRGITALTGNDIVSRRAGPPGAGAGRPCDDHLGAAPAGRPLRPGRRPRPLARRGNPLVLFHLVSGIHNEALMIGFMLAGMEVGLRAGDRLLDRHLLMGAALVVLGSTIKVPALLVLGFLGIAIARRRGGRIRDIAAVAAVPGRWWC
jgi:alpha-1,6-mannosyltransferase